MASNLPDYVASAQPVPQANRSAWFKGTAQTYAGIMLWFVFWQGVPMGPGTGAFSNAAGGTLAQGLGVAFGALILAALLCHFLYYLVPGLLGMKTGLPLYIVGTSTYGVKGGFLLPGFLMGLLQFGWLSVNAFFSSLLLVAPFYDTLDAATLSAPHRIVGILFAVLAAFAGLKGIQYVARVATFFPLIPLVILLVLFFATVGGLGSFDAEQVVQMSARDIALDKEDSFTPQPPWGTLEIFDVILIYVLGFFATAGAAGVDFGMNNRDRRDVQLGGLIGISLATIFAGGLSLLIVAGAYGLGAVPVDAPAMQTTALMGEIVGEKTSNVFMFLLAVAAFPAACFSSFIAANSFKTTLPKVNPAISVGLGTLAAIVLVVTGAAGNASTVFLVIGASFGPICGAMAADYLVAGMKWAGPRRAFNPAGWISWAVGFIVGAAGFIPTILGLFTKSSESACATSICDIAGMVPAPPLSAFVVGFLLYYILAKLGLESKTLEMPSTTKETEAPSEAAASEALPDKDSQE